MQAVQVCGEGLGWMAEGEKGIWFLLKFRMANSLHLLPTLMIFFQVGGESTIIRDSGYLKPGCEGKNEEVSQILSDSQVSSLPVTL